MSLDQVIITAASSPYSPSLLALLGSLNLNWPGHPPVRIYDIGLEDDTLQRLASLDQTVVKVPPFSPHWRKHFTWKIWCLNDAPAQSVLWLDAAIVVLRRLDEVFNLIQSQGYFAIPNYHLLDWEASEAACAGCGVSPEFRLGKHTLAGGVIGFKKERLSLQVLQEALAAAMDEKHIAATSPRHRHDQALLSLLLYKHYGQVNIADGQIYAGWKSPNQVHGQKIWVHRRTLLRNDLEHYAAHISQPGAPYLPQDPASSSPWRYRLKKFYRTIRQWIARVNTRNAPPTIYDGIREQ
ncbi:MAG: hypothetical protein JXB15_02075 [Anaerolineales bacterium]|nr:hypothetical protein [Anaerolineales bacterium]